MRGFAEKRPGFKGLGGWRVVEEIRLRGNDTSKYRSTECTYEEAYLDITILWGDAFGRWVTSPSRIHSAWWSGGDGSLLHSTFPLVLFER